MASETAEKKPKIKKSDDELLISRTLNMIGDMLSINQIRCSNDNVKCLGLFPDQSYTDSYDKKLTDKTKKRWVISSSAKSIILYIIDKIVTELNLFEDLPEEKTFKYIVENIDKLPNDSYIMTVAEIAKTAMPVILENEKLEIKNNTFKIQIQDYLNSKCKHSDKGFTDQVSIAINKFMWPLSTCISVQLINEKCGIAPEHILKALCFISRMSVRIPPGIISEIDEKITEIKKKVTKTEESTDNKEEVKAKPEKAAVKKETSKTEKSVSEKPAAKSAPAKTEKPSTAAKTEKPAAKSEVKKENPKSAPKKEQTQKKTVDDKNNKTTIAVNSEYDDDNLDL